MALLLGKVAVLIAHSVIILCMCTFTLQGLSPTEVIEGYEVALKKTLEILPGMRSALHVNYGKSIFLLSCLKWHKFLKFGLARIQ